jgi:hypothetical protein
MQDIPVAPSIPEGSAILHGAFFGITTLLALIFVAATYESSINTGEKRDVAARRASMVALFTVAWVAVTALVAMRGLLTFDGRPPTMLFLLVITIVLTIALGLSPFGRRLALGVPLAALVGFQAFRILVELSMHRAYSEGLMPVQMSYSGRNFDIVSGVTALLLGLWLATGARRSGKGVVFGWNVLGLLLLLNILVVALLSAPTPLRAFSNDPPNIWVTQFPWVWLPVVMVAAALLGHILVFRRLRSS